KLSFWAHRFKSSTSAIGADIAADICRKIELLAKKNNLPAAVPFIEKLDRQVEVLEEKLKRVLSEMEETQTKAAIKRSIETNIGSAVVIDDDPVVQGMIVAALRGLGVVNVFSASSGKDGLALMAKSKNDIDVVICDLKMPEMDGVEFLRHLVSSNYRGAVILLSGEDSRILNSARQLANAHSFYFVAALQKPVTQLELAGVLAKINRKHSIVSKSLPSKVSLQELEKAIEERQFVVYYQPKVDTYSKQLLGVESLVRWQHPEKGVVMPDDFIPLAEENGLIDALTDLVVDESFAQLRCWRNQGIDITVSINIAVGTIGRRLDFPERIMAYLDSHQLEPQNVILELTESGLMGDIATSLDALVRLRLKGVNLSIDDFGTGYSTFRQLQGIPFTELKIDKGFVMNACTDISSRAILESSILLGQKLGMKLVAEGVESMDDWLLLKKLGCHILQGFYISRPMPGEQLEAWLKKWGASMAKN
ncbi:MAG TPA: EAL domain-containing protein, partial [Candidatus Tenderia electrophaga]|nr:EAL domain-containing protein [Candidatus Tenderia electrophaga]